jgi:predicted DNA-binding transcriptional regulator AlpA
MSRPARVADFDHTAAVAQWPSERRLSAIRPIPRRGLSRSEAAMYVGISATLFDRLIAGGRMPKPRQIEGRKVWDVRSLDLYFDGLPGEDGSASSWDDA